MNRKFYIIISLMVVMLLLLTAAVLVGKYSSDTHESLGRYVNEAKGFSIRFPKDWTTKEGYMGSVVSGISPPDGKEDRFREDVRIDVDDVTQKTNLGEFLEQKAANISKNEGYRELENILITLGEEIEARRLTASYTKSGREITVMLYVIIQEKHGYTIICTAKTDNFDRYRPAFEEITKSFRFEQKSP